VKRSEPLKRGDGLKRVTPFHARSEPQRTGSKPKVKRRKPGEAAAEKLCREATKARSEGMCEVCGVKPATNVQHRKGQGREWTIPNTIHCCGNGNASGCHGRIHQNPQWAWAWGYTVKQAYDPAEVPVWLNRHGWPGWWWIRPNGELDPVGFDELMAVREQLGMVELPTRHKEAS
jgi:hypothetical protein